MSVNRKIVTLLQSGSQNTEIINEAKQEFIASFLREKQPLPTRIGCP